MHQSHNQDIGFQIQQISHAIKQLQNGRLQKENLSISHVNVMFVLFEKDGVTQTYIQNKLGVRASSLSKLLDILIQKGLVYRESLDRDARSKIIRLTELGKEKERLLYKIRDELEQQITQPLAESEIVLLSNLLSKIKNHIKHDI